MELKYKGSFFRDLDKIWNKYLLHSVKWKIEEIERVNNTSQISHLKKLKKRNRVWYKIEITAEFTRKTYWILCVINKNIVEFRRIKSETFFKKKY